MGTVIRSLLMRAPCQQRPHSCAAASPKDSFHLSSSICLLQLQLQLHLHSQSLLVRALLDSL